MHLHQGAARRRRRRCRRSSPIRSRMRRDDEFIYTHVHSQFGQTTIDDCPIGLNRSLHKNVSHKRTRAEHGGSFRTWACRNSGTALAAGRNICRAQSSMAPRLIRQRTLCECVGVCGLESRQTLTGYAVRAYRSVCHRSDATARLRD